MSKILNLTSAKIIVKLTCIKKSEKFKPSKFCQAICQFSATLPWGNELCLKLLHFQL